MPTLEGQVAIVTGASSGIGAATAKALAEEGAHVALAARRMDRLEELQEEIKVAGGKALAKTTDVTSRSDVEALAAATLETFGRIDILVNNAGVMPLSFLKNLHISEWETMVDVNIKGVLYGIGAVLPTMMENKRGHIVNISSVAGRWLFPAGAVYCGTKFAVTAISEGLRSELSPRYGIRCTAIEPGAVATELTNTITDADVSAAFAAFEKMRVMDSEDIARSVIYAVTQPPHVNVAEVLVMPSDQPR